MLIDNVVFFAFLHSSHTPQATTHVGLSVVVEWFGVSSCGYTSSHTCAVPLLLFPHPSPLHVSCVQCRKNRYPLINSKVVKILSSPKGCESSEEELNRSLPPRNIKVEPSGRKSIIKKQTKQVLRLPHLKGYTQRSHDANDNVFLKSHDHAGNSVYTHNLVSSA